MPLCNPHRLRRTNLMLGTALLIAILGAPLSLLAQQLNLNSLATTSSSVSSSLDPPATETEVIPPTTIPSADLPDAPSSLLYQKDQKDIPPPPVLTTNPDAVSPNGNQQTKRVLGLVPNFRTVSADIKLPPMSAKDKFIIAGKDTFDYSALFVAGIQAGFAMNSDSYPEFHQGAAGYARYYWHTLADMTSENFFVGGLGPIVFKQDNRFYTLGHGSFRKRTFYAVTRVLVTRKDDGDETFNFSEVIGSGASAGLSTLWYPKQYQTWTKVGQKWLTSDLIDCFNFWWKEWWPTANKYVFHSR
jgi:hypothetical protein